jgi:hypothetical protein
MSLSACHQRDNTFGPWAGECRGGFDFTLLFEECSLILLPTVFALVVTPPRVWFLLQRRKKLVEGRNSLAILKLVR